MFRSVILLLLYVGIVLVSIGVIRSRYGGKEIVYRDVPYEMGVRGHDMEVSDVFEALFGEVSPWVHSIRTYDVRKQDRINKYFVSQL